MPESLFRPCCTLICSRPRNEVEDQLMVLSRSPREPGPALRFNAGTWTLWLEPERREGWFGSRRWAAPHYGLTLEDNPLGTVIHLRWQWPWTDLGWLALAWAGTSAVLAWRKASSPEWTGWALLGLVAVSGAAFLAWAGRKGPTLAALRAWLKELLGAE